MQETHPPKLQFIHVRIGPQRLEYHLNGEVLSFPISTALAGVGQTNGSLQTPLGLHLVRHKFGYRCDKNTVFVGRKPQADLFSEKSYREQPDRDWILSRILWLGGCEPGKNRLGNVDTKLRYIYIHGTPSEEGIGVPKSHGCIRMTQDDVITLFDLTPLYTQVLITED